MGFNHANDRLVGAVMSGAACVCGRCEIGEMYSPDAESSYESVYGYV